jgi:hypothetical protein
MIVGQAPNRDERRSDRAIVGDGGLVVKVTRGDGKRVLDQDGETYLIRS